MRTVRVRATNAQLEELIELCEVMEQETRREREKHEQATAKRAKPNFSLRSCRAPSATWQRGPCPSRTSMATPQGTAAC